MKTDHLTANDGEALRGASLFKRMRSLCRTMQKGTKWRLEYGRYLRHELSCPLTFKDGNPAAHPWPDAYAQGFDSEEAAMIMDGADTYNSTSRRWAKLISKTRRILLRAAGLKERR